MWKRRPGLSSILSIRGSISGDLCFILIPDRQQDVLCQNVLAPLLNVILVDPCLDYRIDRTGFLAKAAIDAFGHVDIVAGGAA